MVPAAGDGSGGHDVGHDVGHSVGLSVGQSSVEQSSVGQSSVGQSSVGQSVGHSVGPYVGHYVGRFAPSPTGPLHAGSLVAALASWLDARAQGGRWLLRIEDVDAPRCVPGADHEILRQLAALGLQPDAPPLWQSQRGTHYERALRQLQAQGDAYPCACSRKDIAAALAAAGTAHQRHHEWVYPGTCRHGLHGRPARAWRLRCGDDAHPLLIAWHDRRLGPQQQDVTHAVGDFVLQRADGLWAYQLAVVVDDAEQGVTDVVRGEDLADNTARQIHLQRRLGLPTPRYLHTPLVRDARGEKLSKQHGAPALDTTAPLAALQAAGVVLGLPALAGGTPGEWLAQAAAAWRLRLRLQGPAPDAA
jgi:glutamyl-Q tRNA(Asp) synthetase